MTLPEDTLLENRYRIDGLLAHGGMGAIYRAFDTNLSTPVAIKENFFQTPHHIAQFKQEALILARLRHPALPRVSHHFSFEEQQYLVMDYIDGENLWEIVQKRGEPLREKEALDYIIQVCQAVSYLHRQSPPIIHRDIKPQNIKITSDGQAVLVDFGIAKQFVGEESRTEAGAQGITSGFSPPEQYGGGGTNPTSDIYSLGATLYAVLTGQKPPDSVSLLVGRANFKSPDLLNPNLSHEIAQAITHAMQPKMEDRPQTMIDWQRTLEAIAGAAPGGEDEKTTLASTTRRRTDDQETLLGSQSEPKDSAALWLVDPTGLGYSLGPEPLVIGRHSSSDIVIEDLNVSRQHAQIKAENGRCLVKDEGSANGTLLNGHRLRPEWYPISQGDVLIIGPARFYLTATKPVKVAPVKSKPLSPQLDIASDTSEMPPPTAPPPQAQRRPWMLVGVLAVALLLAAGAGGYYLVSQGYFAGGAGPTQTAGVIAGDTQTPAENVPATETAEAVATLTAQATTQAEADAATGQAQAEPTATSTPQSSPTPTASSTATAQPETAAATQTPTQAATPTPTATGTPTPTATRRAAVVTGPTLIPLQASDSIDQIGSREVTDVEINPKNPAELYALVKSDGIYKSSNGGDGPWARMDLDGASITSIVLDPTDPARMYATTWNAVLKTTDGGNIWDPKTGGLVANQVVDTLTIHPANPDILYAGIGETLVVSTDQGQSWSSLGYGAGLGLARLYHIVVDPFNNDVIYIGGLGGSIYKSVDSGRTFIQLGFNTGKGTFGLAAHPTQKDVYLAGFNSFEGGIAKTENGGDFRLVNRGLIFGGADSAYSAITYVPGNPGIVYAGSGYESDGDAKGIFKSIDGGESWSRINNGLAVNPTTGYPHYVKSMAVHPSNPNILFAATGSGLYKSVDGGATWSLR